MMKKLITACLFLFVVNLANAELFIMPEDGTLYIEASGGSAGAVTEIGFGASAETHQTLISNLPYNPFPATEVCIGDFVSGEEIVFSMQTLFRENTYWAFSNDTVTSASQCAFMDLDNSLGLDGSVIQQVGQNQWKMYLDDAASYLYDDDDNDIIVSLRLAPVPEPCSLVLLGLGGIVLRCRKK